MADPCTWERFAKLVRTNQQIGRLLLDQTGSAEAGSMYASEVLHRCGVHPRQLANELSLNDVHCLFDELQKLTGEGIGQRGGRQAKSQPDLLVYGKAGQPCARCARLIEKIAGGRWGIFFCPSCQRLKASGESDLEIDHLSDLGL